MSLNTKKIKFIKKKYVEDALVCDNVVDGPLGLVRCEAKTYPSHQPKTWQHGYFAYCKACRKNFK